MPEGGAGICAGKHPAAKIVIRRVSRITVMYVQIFPTAIAIFDFEK
jgi:hypothetical protein